MQRVVQASAAIVRERPWTVLMMYLVASAPLYFVVSRMALYTPFAIGPTAVDAWIPLLPWTAFPYLTYFLLLPSIVWFGTGRPGLDRVFLTGMACIFCNLSVNVLLPTEVSPRLGPEVAPGTLLALILAQDGTLCALPSGHVSLPVALAVSARAVGWRVWPVYAVWAAVLFVCTLTTGQHYSPDPVAGALFGFGVAVMAGSWLDRHLPA